MTPNTGKGRRTAVVIVVAAIAVFGAALASFVYWRRGETAQGGLDVAAWPDRPAAAVAPDLALSGNISWDQVYEGDPLWIRARIDSPRQRQLFNEAADRRVQSLPATPATFTMPAVDVQWGTVVTMRLAVVDAGGRAAPVFDGPATQFRIQARRAVPFAIDMPMRVEDWMLPAQATAGLRAGHYELTIAWPDAARPLTAAPIPYDVIAPGSNRQRAEHLEHLAQYEFLQGRQPRARALAEQALRLDPDGFDPHRADTLLLLAQIALQMNDTPAAVAAYRILQAGLPPPSENDLAVYVTQELARLVR
jgi:tetratricopeptide (TPR) repeat protein